MKPALLFVIALVGCSDLHHVTEPTFDAGRPSPDAAMDEADSGPSACLPIACSCGAVCLDGRSSCAACPDDERCLAHVFRGCSDAETQWYWDGAECESIEECRDTGSPTRRSCLASHLVCDADLDLEERSFVLLDMRRTCTARGDRGWSFVFVPRDDAQVGVVENVALSLREGLDVASAEVRVLVIGALDPFHDPATFEVGDSDLEIELCEAGACADATQGTFSFETGGAGLGSTLIDVRFGLEPVAVDLQDTWFAYETGVEPDCAP